MHSSGTINPHTDIASPLPAALAQHATIEQVDARDSRAEIVSLFERNGNPQFARQFDWYYRDHGQETPLSWVLRDRKRRVFGLCSVTIRRLRFGTMAVRAGVAGNLFVDRGRGMYLGAFSLVDALKSLVNEKQIDILLGIPNQLAYPVFSRLGFNTIDRWTTYAQISRSRDLLSFHFGLPGRLASPLVDLAAAARRGLSDWVQADFSRFSVIELPESELSKVRFEDWPSPRQHFLNEATSEYLKWRFLLTPSQEYSIVALVSPECEVCSYLVLRYSPGRIWVADCGVDPRQLTEAAAILCFCHDRRALGSTIWVPTLASDVLSAELSLSGFTRMPAKWGGYPDFSLLAYWRPDHPLAGAFAQPTSWKLFPGFNDV
jgi:hypothetical protein